MRRWRIPRWIGWPLLALWTYFVLSFLAEKATFHPSKYPTGLWELQQELGAEDVWLTTSDQVNIHSWLLKTEEEDAPITLYLHGNAGNLTHRVDHIQAILQAGSDLLIIDYRGYGKSEGKPSEKGTYRDSEAAYEYLRRQGHEPQEIILHGESLGTAMAADLAAKKSCAGVILEAPLPSAAAVAQRVLPFIGPLVAPGLETAKKISQADVPVLIIHGDRDEVIPYELGRQVFEAANEPKELWTLEGAHHNDIVQVAGPRYVAKLREFYGRFASSRPD